MTQRIVSLIFYEQYPGSVNDVSQFRHVVDRTVAYDYRHIGFILDRGYFSKDNIVVMDEAGYSFVMMVKGTVEEKWSCHIPFYDLYGTYDRESEALFVRQV